MRKIVYLCLVLFLGLFSCARRLDYQKIHQEALVADLHSDTPLRVVEGFQIGERNAEGHMDIPRFQEGGIDLQVFALWVPTYHPTDASARRVYQLMDSMDVQFHKNADRISLVRTAAKAERVIAEGKIAAVYGIENGVAIESSLEQLEEFFHRGVRYMTLVHMDTHDWAIASPDTQPAFNGLTDFGREVVKKMNELGMMIDISHAHQSTFWEVMEITEDPVIASHSCVWAINHHHRNLKDDQIRAIAQNGGMIGINFYSGYLNQAFGDMADKLYPEFQDRRKEIRMVYEDAPEKMEEELKQARAEFLRAFDDIQVTIEQLVDHIDYVVKLVGPDHVGLGSDFDGMSSTPIGLDDCSKVPLITKELVERGYSEKDIKKILGGNFIRVFREVCG